MESVHLDQRRTSSVVVVVDYFVFDRSSHPGGGVASLPVVEDLKVLDDGGSISFPKSLFRERVCYELVLVLCYLQMLVMSYGYNLERTRPSEGRVSVQRACYRSHIRTV